jgi:hypothetical protein
MLKDAEKLFGQRVLADAVVMPERGKCAPAHMKRGINMSETPVEDAFELFPIIHFVKIELFHGRAGNDHAVEALGFDLVEGFVKRLQMRSGHMRALVGIHRRSYRKHRDGRPRRACRGERRSEAA